MCIINVSKFLIQTKYLQRNKLSGKYCTNAYRSPHEYRQLSVINFNKGVRQTLYRNKMKYVCIALRQHYIHRVALIMYVSFCYVLIFLVYVLVPFFVRNKIKKIYLYWMAPWVCFQHRDVFSLTISIVFCSTIYYLSHAYLLKVNHSLRNILMGFMQKVLYGVQNDCRVWVIMRENRFEQTLHYFTLIGWYTVPGSVLEIMLTQ